MPLLCNVNVLFALVAKRHADHENCLAWWKARNTRDPLLICREVQAALLRLLSNILPGR